MRSILGALVGLCVYAHGTSAQSLSGTVRDVEGRPLAEARIVVLPGPRTAVTDVGGRFRIPHLPPGEYRLEVSLIGYAPERRVVRVGAGAQEQLDVGLRASPLTLTGIEVTASGSGRDPAAVAKSTTQLSGRALERELSGTVAQTLKYQPGMAVRFNGPAAAMPVLRGLTGDRVLVLQDGQRTADLAGSADDHGVTIDPLAAQRVEVVRGPATLLYGNNAVGGVVNVISGDVTGGVPLRSQLVLAAQTESAYPGGALFARASSPVGDAWSVNARAGVRRSGDMRIGRDPELGDRLNNTDQRSWNGALAVSRSALRWSGTVAVRLYDFAYGIPVPPGAEPVDLRGGRSEVAARLEAEPGRPALTSVRLDVTAQDYAHDELDESGVVQQRFDLRTRTATMRIGQTRFGPFRDGAWGAAVLLKRYAATGPAALTPPADSRSFGIFGFQELGLPADAALQIGARFDRYSIASRDAVKFGAGVDRTFDALSGSIGVSVPIANGLTASATASRSFRAPTVEELFSGAPHAGTGSVEYGDARLAAERGRAFEVLLQLRTSRLNGQVAAYDNQIDDFIQPTFVRDTVIAGVTMPVFVYAPQGATLRGAEGMLEVALSRTLLLALRGDYLHARTRDGRPLSYMPPPRAGATVRWDNGRLAFGIDAHHELRQRRTGAADETPVHAHTILRFDGAIRVRMLRRMHSVTFRVDNVLNELHREATSRIRDFAPSAGRNLAVGWRVQI
jgi:iron complex outermembrane recepter protein